MRIDKPTQYCERRLGSGAWLEYIVFSKGIMDPNRNPEMHKNHNMDVPFGARLLLEHGSHSFASKK